MKILAISHSCTADVNQQLFVELSELPGTEVQLVVPARWRQDYSTQKLPPKVLPQVQFKVHALPVFAPGSLHLHFYLHGLREVLKQYRPDVVFVDEEPWSVVLMQTGRLCARLKIPFVPYTKQNILKRYPLLFRWIERHTYRHATGIVALSEEVRDVLRAKGYRGECPLLPHACDLSLFHPGRSEDLRKTLKLSGIVIGYLGRLVPEKGLETIVEAAKQLVAVSHVIPFTVLLVGAGSHENDLKEMVARAGLQGHFVFTGAVPHSEAGDYLRCMDIFVLPSRTTPSWKEQFGRVIVESMACGVPVVGSDSGHIPYLIEETGGGLVFREGNAHDLSEKLGSLMNDPELLRSLGEVGGKAVRANYTYPSIAGKLLEILKSLSSRRNSDKIPTGAVNKTGKTEGSMRCAE